MTIRLLALALLAAAFSGPAFANGKADAAACKAMQAALKPRQQEVDTLLAQRDASAESVEVTGEAWDDAETMRLASAAHASAADTTKAAYEEARQQLAKDELALQSVLKQYNADITTFNTRCTR